MNLGTRSGVRLEISGGTVIDGTGRDPSRRDVVIEDGVIVATGASDTDPSAVTIDADGLTVLPGLIDAHAHPGLPTPAPGANDVSIAEIAGLVFEHTSQMLDAGFTTVRYVGGVDGGLVRAVERGVVRGPRVVTSGPLLAQCGGHGHYAPAFSDGDPRPEHDIPGLLVLSRVCDGPAEVRRAVRQNFRQGASFIKMCVTGGVVSVSDEVTDTQFTVEEIRTAVVEARARGSYVTVHAHNNTGIRQALEAGVRGIEHGTNLDEENAARMAADGVALVPTLAVVEVMLEQETPETELLRRRAEPVAEGMRAAIEVALDAGVTVGLGSDLIGPVQDRRGLELTLRARITDPMEAIVAATSVNAGILGDERIGALVPGKAGDVVLLDGDPLDDPAIFDDPDRVVVVVKAGQVVKDRSGGRVSDLR